MLYPTSHLSKKQIEIKEACEVRFYTFVRVVAPWLCLGHVHEDACDWMQANGEKGMKRSLMLLPRGHLKSKLIALYASWRIIKRPWITILYGSASGPLAERQLYDISNILTGPDVTFYWKGLINARKSERDMWRNNAINVDHITRSEKGIRDHTIRAVSVGAGVTGDHCDVALLDDIIAPNTEADPWTTSGREAAQRWYSQLSSVMNPGSELVAVGTRYGKEDIYNTMMESEKRIYDAHGTIIDRKKVYRVMQKVVETNVQFLWPRQKGMDGEWYGFDLEVLDEIKEAYRKSRQMEQFFAQYYQNPTDEENQKMNAGFLYFEKEDLVFQNSRWHIRSQSDDGVTVMRPLNIFAGMDLAFTVNAKSDYTAIIVEGIDPEGYRYVLDIDRFKTEDPYEMIKRLFNLFEKRSFTKCRIETVAAQKMFVPILKKHMASRGQHFIVDEYKPPAMVGGKAVRISSTLSPYYNLQQIYHFRGGLCEELERQLVESKPTHDDIADVHAAVQEIMYPPVSLRKRKPNKLVVNSRFGGVSDVINQ